MRWSAGAVIGRQLSQIVAALVLARLLGPSSYGVVSAATVYVTFTTLLLDQGLAAALVQRPVLSRRAPGAVASANLLCAAVLGGTTWAVAPLLAHFFHSESLTEPVRALGLGLLVKAAAITPRAMSQRALDFRTIGLADIAGGVVGALAGISSAVLGAGVWAMVVQVLSTDLVIAVLLLARVRQTLPNRHLDELRTILPFSLRIFASNGLAFLSRNLDNILVGRLLGVTALSFYSMAYRVLVIPVQMIGQTTNRVTFPLLSRSAQDRERLARDVARITELLAFVTVPAMGLAAVAAPELVGIALGPRWAATAPVLMILSIAGARETVFTVTQSLMRATGAGRLILRYEILASVVQLSGIVIGLQFGLVGVALGITSAGFLLSPVLLLIQRRLCGLRIRSQLRRLAVPTHAALWAAGSFLLLREVGWGQIPTLAVGSFCYVAVGAAVLRLVHPAATRRASASVTTILRRTPAPTPSSTTS